MKLWAVASSIALVVAANVFVLAGVAADRSGGPIQRVELTQSDLPEAWTGDDNTGIAVRLATFGPQSRERPVLDEAKLVQIGFDCSVPPGAPSAVSHYRRQPAREALVVFQLGGPVLTPVDTGRDFRALRVRYADQGRYLIVPALVRARLRYEEGKPVAVEGWYFSLQPLIHVPQPYARTLRELRARNSYRLTLCYGKRLEPWVCGVRP